MTTHRGQTNEVTEVELASAIEQVTWTRRIAAPGAAVGLEIYTHFVGNGADLQIELVDGKGRKHGVFNEQIAGNRFWAPVRVPAKAEQALVATVKLPKHGLEMTSAALLLTPPVDLRNAQWSVEQARRNDVLTLSAAAQGAPDGTPAEITVWEHDDNGAHALVSRLSTLADGGRVETEWEFDFHEETREIPTAEETEEGYNEPQFFFRVDIGGLQVESELLVFRDRVDVTLTNREGNPLADVRYLVTLPDGEQREGRLDGEGRLVLEDVPPGPLRIAFPDLDEETVLLSPNRDA